MDISEDRLDIELLPARHGDALLVTWGPAGDRHRMVVDGGPAAAYPQVSARLRKAAPDRTVDLLVLTHVDADHIEGTLLAANDAELDLRIREFWFNGPAQIAPTLGVAQGEMLAALIGARGIPLNDAFGQGPVCAPDEGARPVRVIEGLTITVLGPDASSLMALRRAWLPTFRDQGLVFASEQEALAALRARASLNPADTFLSGGPAPRTVADLLALPTDPDTSVANRSSIVLLVEYAGNAVLLAGDSTPAQLTLGVRRLLAERELERLELAAFKLPHHGSTRNLTPELLSLLPSDHYLFSSDGGRFGHPDDAAVAKCLAHGKAGSTLVFNYDGPRTHRWHDDPELGRRGQRARHPSSGTEGIAVSLPCRQAA